MNKLIILAALISTPAVGAKPANLVPASISWAEVKSQMGHLKVEGCSLQQGDAITFLRTKGETFATSRKTFDSIYRDSKRDLDTTLIALDAGQMLCRVKG